MFKLGIRRRRHKTLPKRASGSKQVKVGFPAGKTSQDILNRAIWNHFGTDGGKSGGGWGGPIPERPFIRNAIQDNKGTYREGLKKSAAKILRGDTTMPVVLSKLGVLAQGHIQSEITSLDTPPNSPVTVELKGSSNPLIDTGEMRSRVTWKINDD